MGKARLCNSQARSQIQVKSQHHSHFTEKLGKILAHQYGLQGEHSGLYSVPVLLCLPDSITAFRNQAAPRISDINVEIHPDDNRFLIVHESSCFEPGDEQNLQAIREFILYRTDPCRANDEKLHAVW